MFLQQIIGSSVSQGARAEGLRCRREGSGSRNRRSHFAHWSPCRFFTYFAYCTLVTLKIILKHLLFDLNMLQTHIDRFEEYCTVQLNMQQSTVTNAVTRLGVICSENENQLAVVANKRDHG